MSTVVRAIVQNRFERMLSAVRVVSATAFEFDGQRTDVTSETLVERLTLDLYDQFYSRVYRASPVRIPQGRPDPELIEALSSANSSRERWDRDWTIEAAQQAEAYVVRKLGTARLVYPGQFALQDPYRWPPQNNARASVFFPREARQLQSAFYFAFGETPSQLGDDFALVRLYFNVKVDGATALVALLTKLLIEYAVPFRLKVLTVPAWYDRVDSAVLFIERRYYRVVHTLLAARLSELRAHLDDGTPLLTKRLAAGIGLAESPADGSSFGKARCRLIAQGFWQAYLQRADPAVCIAEQFEQNGISIERAYLNPGATDDYGVLQPTTPVQSRTPPADPYLAAALDIGRRLCSEAVWHGDLCGWLGDYIEPGAAESTPVHKSLGPDLYAGSAGIGLFLAQLYGATGDGVCATTARGAAQHALTRVGPAPGLYLGSTGISYAVARIGNLLDEPQLVDSALSIAADGSASRDQHDVLSGHAGTVVALLRLASQYNDVTMRVRALQAGEALLQAAAKRPLLTGFSHGAAGMAWSLAELFAVSGDARFRDAALALLAYENEYYDARRRNWQDLRPGWRDEDGRQRFAHSWCNGAPGIALARLRMFEILREPQCRVDAGRAFARSARTLRAALRSDALTDLSLCHGLCGLADVLLCARNRRHIDLVHEFAQQGIKRFARDCSWPSGVAEGRNPGLFLGLAGTGYFFLRMHDPRAVPSTLIL